MSNDKADDYELPDEIDFSKWKQIPSPFSQDFRELNLVSLDDDVRAVFPDSQTVNAALRELMQTRKRAESVEPLAKAS